MSIKKKQNDGNKCENLKEKLTENLRKKPKRFIKSNSH